MREGVGVTEIANFAKFAVTGPGAEAWLEGMLANRMPRTGRIVLSPMLNQAGKLIGDFTVAKRGPGDFLVWGSSAAQIYHLRWFEAHLPGDGSGPGRAAGDAADGADARRTEVAGGAGGLSTTTSRTRPSASWTTAPWTSAACRRWSTG